MTDDVYRGLAQRLDTIPNGFPVTDSGVELQILARLFAPEEAALAVGEGCRGWEAGGGLTSRWS